MKKRTNDFCNRNLIITNIRRGKGEREKIIYATLEDKDTKELLISATLEYIVERLNNDSIRKI